MFGAVLDLVEVLGVRALQGTAQREDEAHLGQVAQDVGGAGVAVEVARRRLARQLEVAGLDLRELGQVLLHHLLALRPPLRREEVAPERQLLVLRRQHLGVLHQILVEGGGPRLGDAADDEVGEAVVLVVEEDGRAAAAGGAGCEIWGRVIMVLVVEEDGRAPRVVRAAARRLRLQRGVHRVVVLDAVERHRVAHLCG